MYSPWLKARLNSMGFALTRTQADPQFVECPAPSRVYLACGQQAGPEAKPVVKVGQQLACGEEIAVQGNGVALHASISGTLIEKRQQVLANGRCSTVLVIESDGPDDSPPRLLPGEEGDWRQLSRAELLSRVAQAGVVGMGGAAFPTALKAEASLTRPCQLLILNGSECEPQMSCDRVLLHHEASRVLEGLDLLQRVCRAENLAIALLKRETSIAGALREQARARGMRLAIHLLPNRYSMGSEKMILQACLGREVPAGKLPIDIGALVFNVSTSAAVADALIRRMPLISRIITVAGPHWQRSLRVRIGTRLDFVLDQIGFNTERAHRVIVGGPMMGAAFQNFAHPVLKSTTGFYLLGRKEWAPRPQQNCMRCGDCLPACPVSLKPALLFQLLTSGQHQEAERQGLTSCVECGACSAVCPSGIPLAHSFRIGKIQLKQRAARG